ATSPPRPSSVSCVSRARSSARRRHFFGAPPTSALSPLSLHDALPICRICSPGFSLILVGAAGPPASCPRRRRRLFVAFGQDAGRSEEHTSELQSRENLVCRLLLEKKNAAVLVADVRHTSGGAYASLLG